MYIEALLPGEPAAAFLHPLPEGATKQTTNDASNELPNGNTAFKRIKW